MVTRDHGVASQSLSGASQLSHGGQMEVTASPYTLSPPSYITSVAVSHP